MIFQEGALSELHRNPSETIGKHRKTKKFITAVRSASGALRARARKSYPDENPALYFRRVAQGLHIGKRRKALENVGKCLKTAKSFGIPGISSCLLIRPWESRGRNT